MNRLETVCTMVALVFLLAFSGSGFAAKGGSKGPPGGGGGGGGGGGAAPDLGDLIILYRNANGVPYLTADSCWQPLPSDACPAECELTPGVPAGPNVVPVDPLTCAISAACATCTQEVDFGRINEARSPDTVFASQLDDVIFNLATADCTTLDPAGRIVASTVEDGDVTTKTIDSPLQNLAIYRQLMLTGVLPGLVIDVDGDGVADDPLTTAARALGAASDKSGGVNVDMVAYLNQIMGLTDATTHLGDNICIFMKEEVKGVVKDVEKCFLDYRAYPYNRKDNFNALPAPAYIPADKPVDGWFEYLKVLNTEPPTFEMDQGPIMNAVFDDKPGFTEGNIGGFAQAADDTRAVIDFMHSQPLPGEVATPVQCGAEPTGDTNYDVSISSVSGLQVPKNIVDGSSDREFIVTVANAGPDDATGTLTVTAITAVGTVMANLVGDDPDAGLIPSPFKFSFTDIPPGQSAVFSGLISVNIGQRATINWTAVADAPDDVLPGNDTAEAVSNVKVTGGGGKR